jgi:hypothetical protein
MNREPHSAIIKFENGKTRIMAEAGDALRRIGVDYHCVMFDLHGSEPIPDGATLTVTAEGHCVSGWFASDEIADCGDRVARADIKHKIAKLVGRIQSLT